MSVPWKNIYTGFPPKQWRIRTGGGRIRDLTPPIFLLLFASCFHLSECRRHCSHLHVLSFCHLRQNLQTYGKVLCIFESGGGVNSSFMMSVCYCMKNMRYTILLVEKLTYPPLPKMSKALPFFFKFCRERAAKLNRGTFERAELCLCYSTKHKT